VDEEEKKKSTVEWPIKYQSKRNTVYFRGEQRQTVCVVASFSSNIIWLFPAGSHAGKSAYSREARKEESLCSRRSTVKKRCSVPRYRMCIFFTAFPFLVLVHYSLYRLSAALIFVHIFILQHSFLSLESSSPWLCNTPKVDAPMQINQGSHHNYHRLTYHIVALQSTIDTLYRPGLALIVPPHFLVTALVFASKQLILW
jgi:hypothetical protein